MTCCVYWRENQILHYNQVRASHTLEKVNRFRMVWNNVIFFGPNSLSFSRISKNRCLYATDEKQNEKSENSFAILNDGKYVQLNNFVIDIDDEKNYILCRNLTIINHSLCEGVANLFVIKKTSTDICKIETKEIKSFCACFVVDSKKYITKIPNLLNYWKYSSLYKMVLKYCKSL